MRKKRVRKSGSIGLAVITFLFAILVMYILIASSSYKETTSRITGFASLVLDNDNTVEIGDQVRLDINADDVDLLAGFQGSVRYNPGILEYQSIQEGAFFGDNTYMLDDEGGTLQVSDGYIQDIVLFREPGDSTGTGVIVSLFFEAIAAGTSNLDLEGIVLSNSSGGIVSLAYANSSVTVQGGHQPLSIYITRPTNHQEVTDSMTIETSYTGNPVSASFYFDDELLSTDSSGPAFEANLDISQYVDGPHTIYVTAVDDESNIAVSSPVNITIEGGISAIHLNIEAELGVRNSDMCVSSTYVSGIGTIRFLSKCSGATGTPSVSFPMSLPAGTYYIWTYGYAPDADSDTYLVSVDNGNEQTSYVNGSVGQYRAWQWAQVSNLGTRRSISVDEGTHTFTFKPEGDARLDKIFITNNPSSLPTAIPTDTTPPTVTLNVPGPPSANGYYGDITLDADAQDNYGMSGVRFFVDDEMFGDKDYEEPYSATFDSESVGDGTYSFHAQAEDISGLVANSTKRDLQINNTCSDYNDDDGDGIPACFDHCPNLHSGGNKYGCARPVATKFSEELTTNFSDVDLRNVSGLKIGINDRGQIDFGSQLVRLLSISNEVYGQVNLDDIIDFPLMSVIVNSSQFEELNKSADVKIMNLTGIDNPKVMRDEEECGAACPIGVFDPSENWINFSVPSFSEYSIEEGVFCGDRLCAPSESCSSCEADCGKCEEPPQPPASSCFPAGTKILMADGNYKNIEDITQGEIVASYDSNSNEIRSGRVLETEMPVREHMCKLILENGELLLTDEHPIYTEDGWKAINPENTKRENAKLSVGKLKEGDKIMAEDLSFVEIIDIECWKETIKTYNLKDIENYNNFFADGYLAHNKGTGPGPPGDDDEDDEPEGNKSLWARFDNFDILGISLSFNTEKTDAWLDISEIDNSYNIEGIVVYKTYKFTPINFTSDDVESIEWMFRVPTDWIEENNVDVRSISMWGLADDNWQAIAPEKTSENNEYISYRAEPPLEMSVFIIGGPKITSGDVSKFSKDIIPDTGVIEEDKGIGGLLFKILIIFVFLGGIVYIIYYLINSGTFKPLMEKMNKIIDNPKRRKRVEMPNVIINSRKPYS